MVNMFLEDRDEKKIKFIIGYGIGHDDGYGDEYDCNGG